MLVTLLLALLPPVTVFDSVDIIELNHVFCPTTGNETGVYFLYWELRDGEYVIRDWRSQGTIARPRDNIQEFWDPKTKVNRRIEARLVTESWLWYDREVENRKVWPEAKRKKLR